MSKVVYEKDAYKILVTPNSNGVIVSIDRFSVFEGNQDAILESGISKRRVSTPGFLDTLLERTFESKINTVIEEFKTSIDIMIRKRNKDARNYAYNTEIVQKL